MTNTNILITGATGFIGKVLTKRLIDLNYNILALSRNFNGRSGHKNLIWLKSDLNDFENIKEDIKKFKPEIVIHLSWENIPVFNLENSLKNLNNSINFFKFIFNINSCRKVLVSGSCLEYSKSFGVCKEDEHIFPNNHFTWAKNSLRLWLEFEILKSNCKLGWFRIFYVYGFNQRNKSLIPSLIDTFKNKKPMSINNIYNANDFVYIDDVVNAFILFLKSKDLSGVYNLGTGKTTPISKISYIVEKLILGTKDKTDKFFKYKKENNLVISSNFSANIDKAINDLKWSPKYSIKDGLSKMLDHYNK